MQISVEPLPGRSVAQWERLMALHAQPRADLKGPRIRDHILKLSSPTAKPLLPAVVAVRAGAARWRFAIESWRISSASNRSKKGLSRRACGAISGHPWTAVPMRVGV
jgi:hypothetical protein